MFVGYAGGLGVVCWKCGEEVCLFILYTDIRRCATFKRNLKNGNSVQVSLSTLKTA